MSQFYYGLENLNIIRLTTLRRTLRCSGWKDTKTINLIRINRRAVSNEQCTSQLVISLRTTVIPASVPEGALESIWYSTKNAVKNCSPANKSIKGRTPCQGELDREPDALRRDKYKHERD